MRIILSFIIMSFAFGDDALLVLKPYNRVDIQYLSEGDIDDINDFFIEALNDYIIIEYDNFMDIQASSTVCQTNSCALDELSKTKSTKVIYLEITRVGSRFKLLGTILGDGTSFSKNVFSSTMKMDDIEDACTELSELIAGNMGDVTFAPEPDKPDNQAKPKQPQSNLSCSNTQCGRYLNANYTCDEIIKYGLAVDCNVCKSEGRCNNQKTKCEDTMCGKYLANYSCDYISERFNYDCSDCISEGKCSHSSAKNKNSGSKDNQGTWNQTWRNNKGKSKKSNNKKTSSKNKSSSKNFNKHKKDWVLTLGYDRSSLRFEDTSSIFFDSDSTKLDSRNGFSIYVEADFNKIQIGIGGVERGGLITLLSESEYGNNDVYQKEIEIDWKFRYWSGYLIWNTPFVWDINDDNENDFIISAGLQFGIISEGEITTDETYEYLEDNQLEEFNTDWGWLLCADYWMNKNYGMRLSYYHGFQDLQPGLGIKNSAVNLSILYDM